LTGHRAVEPLRLSKIVVVHGGSAFAEAVNETISGIDASARPAIVAGRVQFGFCKLQISSAIFIAGWKKGRFSAMKLSLLQTSYCEEDYDAAEA
jgi:hypothetical protein